MRLFSYIIAYDSGFAPNPFWGYCTLATCKPRIRSAADIGDFIIGISPKADSNKFVFAMEVNEKLTFEEYFNDPRFERKKPKMDSIKFEERLGDNIYKPLGNGEFQQLYSLHSNEDGSENIETKKRDLSGKYVLISTNFVYFGSNAINLPDSLQELIVTRGYKSNFSDTVIREFLSFVRKLPKSVQGMPKLYSKYSCGLSSSIVDKREVC
ncbi:hypothetical protein [Deferribacter abyssi]|uniref:Nmad2 family putative nucleotide modification protein n=1 Tax=Deferribacter abyssi TaxID=213806 RepID=UPI003C16D96B